MTAPQQRAEQRRRDDRQPERPAPLAVGEPESHARERDDRADGQVDPAAPREDHQQLGEAEHGQRNGVDQAGRHVVEVVVSGEVAARVEDEEPDDDHDDQHGEQRDPLGEQRPQHAGGPCSRLRPVSVGVGAGGRCGRGRGHRVLRVRARSRSVPTATMMKIPTKRSDSCELQPSWVTPEVTDWTSSAPSKRAQHRPAAAHDRRAADHDRGDDRELLAGADRLVERRGALGDDEARAQPDQQAGDAGRPAGSGAAP